jgi:hypothetical protein
MITSREIEDKDLIPLAEFLPEGFGDTTKEFWLGLFEFWWTKNPAYTDQIPRGWVLESDGKIIGFLGNIPLRFIVQGKVKIAAASNSWYVDPKFRGIQSLRLFNKFTQQKDVSLLLFKAEDDHYNQGMAKYRFSEYILPPYQQEYVYFVNRNTVKFNFVKFMFNEKIPNRHDLPEFLKRLGSFVISYIYQKPLPDETDAENRAYVSSVCSSCDDDFPATCRSSQRQYNSTLSCDLETLNWLYFSPGRHKKRVVIQCRRSKDAALAGYMVFRILPYPGGGIMQLLDLCIDDKNPRVLSSLLSSAVETGKRHDIRLLEVWGNTPETEAYFRRTFTLRRSIQYYQYIRFSDSAMNSGTDKPLNVYLSLNYPPQ